MMRKRKYPFLISLLLAFCFLLTACEKVVSKTAPASADTVTALNVGQAACTLIESGGKFCVVDAGKTGGGEDVRAYLSRRGVKTIDLLVLTHFHQDHTSEALDIIRNFEIKTVLIPSLSRENIPDSYLYKSLLEDGKNGYFDLKYAVKGMEFTVGNGSVKVLADTINTENINNTSIAVSFTQGDFIYVNTGDMECDGDKLIIDDIPQNVTLYTAAHHGSKDANSYELLEKLNPSLMVISCGEDNSYGHPHKSFLNRADDLKIPYLITYEQGNIVLDISTGEVTADKN